MVAALVLGACGDDGVSGAQREHAERAEAVCLEMLEAVGRNFGDDPAAERDAVKRAADRLEQMNPPSEDEPRWTLIVAEMNNLWLQLSDAAEARDPMVNDMPRAQRALERVNQTTQRMRNLTSDYGMQECAEEFPRA
ncbi:MAG: hypothetical protein M3144_13405 [Actinomycetota bacterium]|nr:hypothetical protein [Actinomycetota bacterium]